MWPLFTVSLLISLSASCFFFMAHKRRPRTLEGLIALASMMICLGIAPFPIQVVLLSAIFAVVYWRVQWEKAQETVGDRTHSTP
ncbi:MAG: hypothetical protein AAFQ63_03560 [Cyanobacteria bacterium J06621_11]